MTAKNALSLIHISQQMEENVKGADGMENRQGDSFDEMSQSIENETDC